MTTTEPLPPQPVLVEGISSTPAAGWWVISDAARPGDPHVWIRHRVAAFAVTSSEPYTDQQVVPLIAGTTPDGSVIGAPVLEPSGSGFLRHDLDHTVCECETFDAGILDPRWCDVCAGVRP